LPFTEFNLYTFTKRLKSYCESGVTLTENQRGQRAEDRGNTNPNQVHEQSPPQVKSLTVVDKVALLIQQAVLLRYVLRDVILPQKCI